MNSKATQWNDSIIIKLIIVVCLMRAYMPYVNYGMNHILSLLILILGVFYSTRFFNIPVTKILSLAFLLFINIIIDSLFEIGNDINQFTVKYYAILQYWPFAVIGYGLLTSKRTDLSQFVIGAANVVFLITSITTIFGLQLYPGASRSWVTGQLDDATAQLYASLNIGGFEFVYGLSLLIPLLVYSIRYSTISKKTKLLYAGLIAIFVYAAFASEFTTAILVIIVTSIIIIGVDFKNITIGRALIYILSAALLYILQKGTLADMFYFLSTQIDSYDISTRFSSIGDALRGIDTSGSDLEARQDVWKTSLSLFLESPIIGTGGKGGGHSFIFDYLAFFGLIGAMVISIAFRTMFKFFYRPFALCEQKNIAMLLFGLQLVYAFINPVLFYSFMTLIAPAQILNLQLQSNK